MCFSKISCLSRCEYKIIKAELDMVPMIGEIVGNTIKEIYPSISIARFYRMEIIRRKNDY